MELEKLPFDLTVCKVRSENDFDWTNGFYFVGKTDEEFSVVCETAATPAQTVSREDGWKGFRIRGELDFSLIGILAKITAVLAAQQIGIFAVSTYNTDYILVKREQFEKALRALSAEGYLIV